MKTLTFLLIIACFFADNMYGMTTYQYCHVYKVESSNHEYYLWSYPYDNIVETTAGRTVVYKADSTVLYEIPRYFEVRDSENKLFLSDDGETIIYILNREYEWEGVEYKCVEIYKDGKRFKEYSMLDLSGCDDEDEYCYLLYRDAIKKVNWDKDKGKYILLFKDESTEFEKKISEEPVYYSNNTVYIFTNKNILVKLDVLTGNVLKEAFNSLTIDDLAAFNVMNMQSFKYDLPYFDSIIGELKLTDGKLYEEELAKYIDMRLFPKHLKYEEEKEYKKYFADVGMYIDSTGKAHLLWIKDRKSVPRDKVEGFLYQVRFETSKMPKNVDKWYVERSVSFMNKDEGESKRERKQEVVEEKVAYEKRLVADSIDGVYIPKNIEECFIELNKLLKPKDIEQIKKEGGGLYHFGLGMWLRNNWGLWGGSRLQVYLKERGEWHPDDMSGTILDFYRDWLNDKHERWQKYDTNKKKK